MAKKLGKVYRIPASSLSFIFTGMDADIYQAQLEDEKNISKIEETLKAAREKIWEESKSF